MQHAMIKCLPKEVQGKLRSGVALPSLQQCVEELLVNSIDAGATCVGVRVDMDAFRVQVIDNGRGMSAEDIGCVGNRYYTSKCNSLADLEDLGFYGFRGEALASIVSLATLVEISSRTKESMKTHVKIFREGTGLDVFEAETTRPSSGTTVTVCNYYHNMPVRRKRVDAVLENERIRQRVEAISLMHPSVSFTLKNDCTGAMVVQLPKARNTYYRFVQTHSLARAQKLGEINYTSGQFEVKGYIGKEGHYNNSLQFLYVNERLLLRTRIHKLLNALLRRLSSLSQKTDSPESHIMTRSPKVKRNQELYGVFIVNIKCPYSDYDISLEPAKTLIEFKDWDGILLCIEESVKDFLKRENLETELSQDDLECESPTDINGTYQTNTIPDAGVSGHFLRIDAGIETILSSEFVYRSHTDEPGNKMDCKDDDVKQEERENVSTNTEDSKLNSEPFGVRNSFVQPNSGEVGSTSDDRSRTATQQSQHFEQSALSKETTSSALQLQTSKHLLSNVAGCTASQHSSINTRKVTLSDPFIHESLQIEKQNSGFQLVETSLGTKRKISLGTSQKTSWEEGFHVHVPVKIRKMASLSNISQSLDQFRRIHNNSKQLSEDPKWKGFLHKNAHCEKIQQGFGVTNTKEEQSHSVHSPPASTAFTELKPATSVASKLCQLRQNKKDPCITPLLTMETTSLANNEITGGCTQNKDNLCYTKLNIELGSAHIASPDQTEETLKTTSDDWVPHYDSSVGKTVYVNKVTGLSSYEEPSTEQAEMRCTSDVTNMAISVLSETGMEYICYPFHMDIVLSFLPKSRTERVCWSGLEDRGISVTGDDDDENENSLYSMYSKWNNPVFVRPPKVCVDISSGQADGLAVKVHNILFPYRFSKSMIPTMKVIDQVDKKFLACLINTREDLADGTSESDGNLLVLMDQHAAHERVRLENLIADAYEDIPGEKRLSSSIISPPLEVSLPIEEQRLLRSCKAHLQCLGLEITFSQTEDSRVFIGKVPLCFTEKDNNEQRRGRPSVIKPLVEEYLREQIELLHSAGRLRATLPLTVQKVLASFACHGAIKFNDILNKNECFSLVASLSACQLPFQCAHGRPSIAPLVDLRHIDQEEKPPSDMDAMSSTCRPDSPTGTLGQKTPEDASSPTSSESSAKEVGQDTSFVPTVTAISSTPDFQWMVQPTIITSASPSLGNKQANEPQSLNKATPKAGGNKGKTAVRKGKAEQLSPEEEEKKRIRRERNKMAAAKCRNRRRELTDTLQAETDKLEEEKATLETEIAILLKEKERLEFILASHKPVCQMSEEMESIFQESTESSDLLSSTGEDRLPEDSIQEAPSLQDMDIPSDPSTAISGNSNILLCSSAEINICDLEPSLDLKEGVLDNMLPSLEEKTPMETARSVPDIDLSSSLGMSDWETLYKSVSNDLEPLSTPVVTSTPTCSSYLSVFTFACPDLDSLTDELDNHKTGTGKAESVDILNSPTLLAL